MATKTKTKTEATTTSRFRADVSRGLEDAEGIDRDAGVIRGYAVISKGMARGHGVEIDDVTLEQVVTLGKKRGGVKSRFGHPSMSNDSLGTFLGRAKKFRRDGDVVRADLHLDETSHETPNGDLGGYVLGLAESDPAAFGSSIVFEGSEEYRVDEDGTAQRDNDGKTLPPLARVETLHASDIVDSPAATNGMFATQFFTADCELSAQAAVFLDKFIEQPEAVDKAIAFLRRYSTNRADVSQEDATMAKAKEETKAADVVTVEKVGGEPKTYTANELTAAVRGGVAQELKAERERVAAIRENAMEGQEALAAKAESEGLSVAEAQALFIKDRKERDAKDKETALEALGKDPAKDIGPNLEKAPTKKADEESGPVDEVEMKRRWESDASLRKSFRQEFESFAAYEKAKARGEIKEKIDFDFNK